MNKNLNIFFTNKKNYKVILYLLIFFVIIFSTYIFTPSFFSYTPALIQESLKKNSNIKIKNISNIDYKFFPSPRLKLSGINLEFGDNIMEIADAKVDIILNPLSIIKYKILDYDKLLVNGGSTNIQINKYSKLFNYIKKNQKKVIFKKNKIILLKENKKLFKINDSLIKINTKNNIQYLNINGLFLSHQISFSLENKLDGKIRIKSKIPKLNLLTNILLEKKNNSNIFEGLVNLEVNKNFFQFNLTKEKNIIIKNGFMRSGLTNSSFNGILSFNPYFFFNLDIEPTTFDIEKLITIIQNLFFLESSSGAEVIKKIEGSLNFQNIFDGSIIFKNREIFFKNFNVGKNNQIFFDAQILKFGKKGKIKFNLISNIQNKKTNLKNIKVSGFLIPSSSQVIFKKIIVNKKILSKERIKNYEEKFKNEVIENSLSNIFNKSNIDNFFKNF
jgi:hypothetical protein|tara:strand:+ start:10829 stop:12160 length:1332 start_codon:yes stop_codon:yes gene_type:complete